MSCGGLSAKGEEARCYYGSNPNRPNLTKTRSKNSLDEEKTRGHASQPSGCINQKGTGRARQACSTTHRVGQKCSHKSNLHALNENYRSPRKHLRQVLTPYRCHTTSEIKRQSSASQASDGTQPSTQRQPDHHRTIDPYAPRNPPPSGGRSAASLA
jgi:hypothetical protein